MAGSLARRLTGEMTQKQVVKVACGPPDWRTRTNRTAKVHARRKSPP